MIEQLALVIVWHMCIVETVHVLILCLAILLGMLFG